MTNLNSSTTFFMQTLAPINPETRKKWILLLLDLAKKNSNVKFPFVLARSVENEAYNTRQSLHVIDDGITVYRYGETDLLDIEPSELHHAAALQQYCKVLRKVAWALHGSKSLQSSNYKDWVYATDEDLKRGTLQETWEKEFFERQSLAKQVLSGANQIETSKSEQEKEKEVKGIFSCPRCKSYNVDTEQKQTRSADEPMTIFCTCNVCHKRFVF